MPNARRQAGAVDRRTVLLGALCVTLLTACGGAGKDAEVTHQPRALTSKEAELLALARFRLHQLKVVPVRMVWPGSPSAELDVTLDLHGGVGFGRMLPDEDPDLERLIVWNTRAIGTAPVSDAVPDPAAWTTRALSPSDVPSDILLTLALSLGSDRPENPVLVQQSSARFLRRDEVDGRSVMVAEGPRPAGEAEKRGSRSRYWIDDEGKLVRFEAYLGDSGGRFAQLTVTEPHDEIAGLRKAADQVLATGQR